MSEVNEFESMLDNMQEINENDLVMAEVVSVGEKEIMVNISGHKNDIPIPAKELDYPVPDNVKDLFKIGDQIEVVVLSKGGENGLVVSKVKAAQEVAWKQLENLDINEEFDCEVTQAVKGGLVAMAKGVRAFIPASHIELHYIKDLAPYVGKTLRVVPLDPIDVNKHRLVLSAKKILEKNREKNQAEVFETKNEGDIVKGIVKRIVDYGAFIDIGGVDGLLHISDISWNRVNHPSEVLKEGEEVSVLIKSIDREAKRISLSIKDTLPDPWLDKAAKYSVGQIIEGKINKLTTFGVFMQLEPGFDGLIPMGELSTKRIENASDVVQKDQIVKVKITKIDTERKRISLSITKAKENTPLAAGTEE